MNHVFYKITTVHKQTNHNSYILSDQVWLKKKSCRGRRVARSREDTRPSNIVQGYRFLTGTTVVRVGYTDASRNPGFSVNGRWQMFGGHWTDTVTCEWFIVLPCWPSQVVSFFISSQACRYIVTMLMMTIVTMFNKRLVGLASDAMNPRESANKCTFPRSDRLALPLASGRFRWPLSTALQYKHRFQSLLSFNMPPKTTSPFTGILESQQTTIPVYEDVCLRSIAIYGNICYEVTINYLCVQMIF